MPVDATALRVLIEEAKVQQWRAAELLGVSTSCVERACKRLGLRTARTGPRRGPEHPDWKGGRILIGGYWHIWLPDHPNATKRGYIAEHRKLIADKLGRPLELREVVHHIDGNPQNNDPANLMLFQTNSDHLRHELTGRVPNWTPEGKARMGGAGRRSDTRHHGKEPGDSSHTRTSRRATSKP
jgi:hypothetical protein